jgi:sialate O-acetylesterase
MCQQAGFGSGEGPVVETPGGACRGWPWLREAVSEALALPFTGMAVATDLALPGERHPPDQLHVGRRLALLARHRVYGEEIPDS